MVNVSGKTALVTGASRGIGRAVARRLAAEGVTVVINFATRKDQAEAVVSEIESAGGRAFTAQGDISDVDALDAMFKDLRRRIDGIDILVNNAGRAPRPLASYLDTVTPEEYDAIFGLNTRALFFMTQRAVRMMRDGGRIISISSMASRLRYAGVSPYAGSKAAVEAFSRIWAQELAPRRITVNVVQAGLTDTGMLSGMAAEARAQIVGATPLGRIGQPEDIADVVAFLASDDSRWITGHEIPASGGRYV